MTKMYIRVVQGMYEGSMTAESRCVITDGFQVEVGLHQGLAFFLFEDGQD